MMNNMCSMQSSWLYKHHHVTKFAACHLQTRS